MNVDVIEGLIAMVRANDNHIDSRIRLQKQVYILQQMGFPGFASLRYRYHHFGPYSRDLSDDAHSAVLDGLLTETFEQFTREYTRYSYQVTDKGEEYYSQPLPERYAHMVAELKEQHWRVLELTATTLYLQRTKRLAPAEAFERAVALKPACHEYRDPAARVLQELSRQSETR